MAREKYENKRNVYKEIHFMSQNIWNAKTEKKLKIASERQRAKEKRRWSENEAEIGLERAIDSRRERERECGRGL